MNLRRTATPTTQRRRRRVTRLGLIAGITTFLVLVGSGVSYAYWTAAATATATASAATLEITTTGFDTNSFAFQNHRLTTTGSVTLTNTTTTANTTAGSYAMTLGYTGDASLAANLAVSIWPTTNTAGCPSVVALPTGTVTGYWDTVAPAGSPLTGALTTVSPQSFCVRVSSAERSDLASTAGSMTIQPSISATLTVGNWSESTSSTTTQNTEWIFPAFGPTANTWYQIKNQSTGKCLDVFQGAKDSTESVIDYSCKGGNAESDYNQEWKFTVTTGSYFDVTSRRSLGTRIGVDGDSVNPLAAVATQLNDDANLSQEWQLQKQPSGNVYQIVNRRSGMCLQPYDTAVHSTVVEYAQAVCDGSTGQQFTLTWKDADVPVVVLSCAPAAAGGVTFSWTDPAIATYNFQAKPNSGSTWNGIGDALIGSTSFTVLPAAISGADGQYNVQAQWLTNHLDSSNLWKSTTGTVTSLGCSAPLPPLNSVTCTPSTNGAVNIAWGHAAVGAYTIQLWSNNAWLTVFTAAQGSTNFTIPGEQNWFDGTRDMRVKYGATTVNFQVYNSDNGSSYLWCLPPQTIAATFTNSSGSGDSIRITWPMPNTSKSKVRVTIPGIPAFTKSVNFTGSTAYFDLRDVDVVNAPTGSSIAAKFQLEIDSTLVALLPDQNVRITRSQQGTDIFLAP